jgi:hypothetical protein
MNIRFTYLIWVLVVLSCDASAHEKMQHHEKLKNAILCGANGINDVREIAALGSQEFDDGYAGFSFGEEMMVKDIVILKEPLEIYGAKTNGVIVDLEAPYFDFSGIVYSRFKGDYDPVVKNLGLIAVPGKKDRFYRNTGKNIEGKPENVCALTIELHPLEKNEFLLGCGWCNG